MARILTIILWLLSFLIVWPVAAQHLDTTHTTVERSTYVDSNSSARPNEEEPVRLGKALRSLWASSESKKSRKFLVWIRQCAKQHLKVT